MRGPTQLSEATIFSEERRSRGRTLSSWMKVGENWVWGPVGWRFGCGDQWGGDLGMGTSGVEIWVWGPVGWRFGCADQWGGDLSLGTSGVEIWVWGPESVIFTERYWYHCLSDVTFVTSI